eukprot:5440676-Amphidinium_carterae.1
MFRSGHTHTGSTSIWTNISALNQTPHRKWTPGIAKDVQNIARSLYSANLAPGRGDSDGCIQNYGATDL